MARLPDLINGFKMLKEVDLNAVHAQAEAPFSLMVVGRDDVGMASLVGQLLEGPRPGEPPGLRPVTMHRLEPGFSFPDNALVLILMDEGRGDYSDERALFDRLTGAKRPVVVCLKRSQSGNEESVPARGPVWQGANAVAITVDDRDQLIKELVPVILLACKGKETQLARNIPLLRGPVAQQMIEDTCFINATYSLGSGLAEMVPVLDLPLNIADILVLTKNQALMSYKITLAMGMKAEWRDTMPKLAAVVGSAFIWRQLARYLAGLIPVIGIVPKVVISYAGTYVVGEAVYQWCVNGEKLNAEQLRELYVEALKKGSETAKLLMDKGDIAQRQAADRFSDIAQEISKRSVVVQQQASGRIQSALSNVVQFGRDLGTTISSASGKLVAPSIVCGSCGKKAPKGAAFCAYCGKPLDS